MMKIISHRGNLNGSCRKLENTCAQLEKSIELGFNVELDLWLIEQKIFLGHDKPNIEIDKGWLNDISEYSWIHCKNIEVLEAFIQKDYGKKLNLFIIKYSSH